MKILFVCKGNMTRSQMAEEFYNRLAADGERAKSAGTVTGTIPEEPEGWQLDQVPYLGNILAVMKEEGFDLSHKRTVRLTPELMDEADLVINMAEKETMPDFLSHSPKVIYWDVPNPAETLESAIATRDMIKKLVSELIESRG